MSTESSLSTSGQSDALSDAPSDSSSVQHAQMVSELHALFNHRPPLIPKDSTWTPTSSLSPFWFYDKHLDEKLILRHVKPMESLAADLAGIVDRTLCTIEGEGINLPFIGSDSYFATKTDRSLNTIPNANDSHSLAILYGGTTAFFCHPVASTLAIHPHTPDWMSWLMWRQVPTMGPPEFNAEGYALRLRSRDMRRLEGDLDLMELLDEDTVKTLEGLAERFPAMATWYIGEVSDRSEAVLRDMGRVLKAKHFQSILSRTIGYTMTPTTLCPPPDAISTPWNIPGYTELSGAASRRSSRLKKTSSSSLRRVQELTLTRTKKFTGVEDGSNISDHLKASGGRPSSIFPACVSPSSEGHSLAEHIVQHTWTQAVFDDTSIIVFYCGNFERIGIRHRESQTLYLSPVIDPAHCEPAYGKIHVGLYIAAYQDTLDRFEQLRASAGAISPPLHIPKHAKRPIVDDKVPKKRSRRRVSADDEPTNVGVPVPDLKIIFENAGKRSLCLVRLEYGIFNSISPTSFIRIGRSLSPIIGPTKPSRVRRKYSTQEYFTLIIYSPVGQGATGITHGATLELTTAENQTLTHQVAVKLAFSEEQQRRMRREYSIYDHMSSKGVGGAVPQIYGLFEDLEGGTMALIMSHAGVSLWDRRPNKKEDPPAVSPEERSKFLEAMRSIHEAGVRHNDLRAPNLLINEANEVTILDFDQADLHSSDGAKKRELAKFIRVLDGDHFKPLVGYISNGNSAEDQIEKIADTPTLSN